jgi:hypothetical protein
MIAWLKHFWCNYVQTSFGAVLAAIALIDVQGLHDTLANLFTETGYHVIRLACSIAIVVRGVQAIRAKSAADSQPRA